MLICLLILLLRNKYSPGLSPGVSFIESVLKGNVLRCFSASARHLDEMHYMALTKQMRDSRKEILFVYFTFLTCILVSVMIVLLIDIKLGRKEKCQTDHLVPFSSFQQ